MRFAAAALGSILRRGDGKAEEEKEEGRRRTCHSACSGSACNLHFALCLAARPRPAHTLRPLHQG